MKGGILPEKESASTDSLVDEGGRQGGEIIHQRIVIASTQSSLVLEAVALAAHEARLLIPVVNPVYGQLLNAKGS